MTTLEILLLVLGVVVFIASFVMPETQGEMDAVDKQLTKEQEKIVTVIEAFKDYKAARKYLESVTSKDLENPEVALNVNKLKLKWNFG